MKCGSRFFFLGKVISLKGSVLQLAVLLQPAQEGAHGGDLAQQRVARDLAGADGGDIAAHQQPVQGGRRGRAVGGGVRQELPQVELVGLNGVLGKVPLGPEVQQELVYQQFHK